MSAAVIAMMMHQKNRREAILREKESLLRCFSYNRSYNSVEDFMGYLRTNRFYDVREGNSFPLAPQFTVHARHNGRFFSFRLQRESGGEKVFLSSHDIQGVFASEENRY